MSREIFSIENSRVHVYTCKPCKSVFCVCCKPCLSAYTVKIEHECARRSREIWIWLPFACMPFHFRQSPSLFILAMSSLTRMHNWCYFIRELLVWFFYIAFGKGARDPPCIQYSIPSIRNLHVHVHKLYIVSCSSKTLNPHNFLGLGYSYMHVCPLLNNIKKTLPMAGTCAWLTVPVV